MVGIFGIAKKMQIIAKAITISKIALKKGEKEYVG